jgi:signal transduction histidine kinase/ActR/RegA family two-component response regulator
MPESLTHENLCRAVLENIPVGISVISSDMRVLSLNPQMKEWFPEAYDTGNPLCYRTFNTPPHGEICPNCKTALTLCDGQPHDRIVQRERADGQASYRVLSYPIRDAGGNVVAAVELVEDVTEQLREKESSSQTRLELEGVVEERAVELKALNEELLGKIRELEQAEQTLRHRVEMERRVAAISTRFINLPPEKIDQAVTDALGTIGAFCDVDRSYVFSVNLGSMLMSNTHEWCAANIERQKEMLQDIPLDTLPWLVERLSCFDTIHIPVVADMPPEAAEERDILEPQGIKSLLVVPMVWQNQLKGFIGFDSVKKERQWSDEDILVLNTLSNILTQALAGKQTAEELRKAKDTAEDASRLKSEFLANVSHEVRTPLNGVMGMLQLLRVGRLQPEQKKYVEIALGSGKSLLQILNDILDLSKIEAGKIDISEEEVNLGGVMRQASEIFVPQVLNKGLDLRCDVDAGVPSLVLGDGGRIRQVLFNLLGNAVKFTMKGEVRVTAVPETSSGQENRTRVCFSVFDTGIGIPSDKLEHVFDPFTQVDGSHGRIHQGTGLGLSIVKRLVNLMGGSIEIESQVGIGTTVRFYLDFEIPSQPGQEKSAGDRAIPPIFQVPQSKLHILLAEDDEVNRFVATRMLEKLGHTVVCAHTGREVLRLLEGASFDCILMDIQMSEMDGFKTTHAIRHELSGHIGPSTPIIAMTAHAMQSDKDRCLEAGMDAFLTKPMDMEELGRILAVVAPMQDGRKSTSN